ncbi:MAG: lytic transglycosylase domain-containing protein [Deltaproteobacteria bacterium]|nr:lytic transglycosylase domain-containing protein [Deltaproteobacteria bacterium]
MTARGDIYKFVDGEGVVHFTNVQPDGKYRLYLREGARSQPRVKSSGYDGNGWMAEYVNRYCKAHDLSPALVHAIIKAESDGQRKAVSSKGAKGVMQLMPFTSKRMNVGDPFDPIENIEGGIRYIKELLATFDGDITHAVAAYNAGPGAVKKYGGVPPYKETRLYVQRVLSLYRKYSSAE